MVRTAYGYFVDAVLEQLGSIVRAQVAVARQVHAELDTLAHAELRELVRVTASGEAPLLRRRRRRVERGRHLERLLEQVETCVDDFDVFGAQFWRARLEQVRINDIHGNGFRLLLLVIMMNGLVARGGVAGRGRVD